MNQRLALRGFTVFFVGFISLWVAAWLVALTYGWVGDTFYWAVAKVTVWVLYPLVFWRMPIREQLAFIGLRARDLRRGLCWGVAAAAVWVSLSLAIAALRGQHLGPAPTMLDILYTGLLTPVCEEWLFRGYVQTIIIRLGHRFWAANGLTSVLFLVPHLVGWSFEGVLEANALSAYPFTIFVLSLGLGYVRHRSGSLLAGILLHSANNVMSLWWR
jgi:membrane protease YdiL (CAAX protease family)